jgi:hypothetical protein
MDHDSGKALLGRRTREQLTARSGGRSRGTDREECIYLWAHKRTLPRSIPEVLARCDEIVFAEKIRRNIHTWEYIDNYRKLSEEDGEPRPKNSRAD